MIEQVLIKAGIIVLIMAGIVAMISLLVKDNNPNPGAGGDKVPPFSTIFPGLFGD